MKRTSAFLVVLLALLVAGICLRPGSDPVGEEARSDSAASRQGRVAGRGGTGGSRLVLPDFDPERSLRAHPVRKGHPLRFAEAMEVAISPERHGRWEVRGGRAVWKLAVEAPGALNLNFGFRRFGLPAGASLELRDEEGRLLVRPFTRADIEDHGELWTPVLAGDRAELVLLVDAADRGDVDLELGRINRGFRPLAAAAGHFKIGDNAPLGNCHVDVVCSGEQSGVGAAIDLYRDQIRSAALFTLQGIDTCSGVAVNNARRDGKPYFLTADHCGVGPNNAGSLVVYWNFQNSSCRAPGSGASGLAGDGPVTDFNSGAIFRATNATADTTLVELDDPIDRSHGVFLSGWSRGGSPSMGVAVHHPNLSEKRISFEFDALQSTADSSDIPDPGADFWRVVDWDFGSTEGGSSGSPLFDQDGRLVGVLSGGFAACGNNQSDWYGKFSRAWTGGGSSTSRLSDWLDPDRTGVMAIGGLDLGGIGVTVRGEDVLEGSQGTGVLAFEIILSKPPDGQVELLCSTRDGTAEAGSDYQPLVDVPLRFAPGEDRKSIEVVVVGDLTPEEHETVRLVASRNGGPGGADEEFEGVGTILNDDYVIPEIDGPAVVAGTVAHPLESMLDVRGTPTEFGLEGAPEGMTISGSGLLEWIPSAAGSFEIRVMARNPAGAVTETVRFEIAVNQLVGGVEAPEGVSLTSGSSVPWRRAVSAAAIRLGDLAESGRVADNEQSWLELGVEGPDYVGFWWRVSSEEGYDFLTLDVDGDRRAAISGEPGWAYQVVAIPTGWHRLRWSYTKDLSVSEGLDRGWVDFVQVASHGDAFLMEDLRLKVRAGERFDYQLPTYDPDTEFLPQSMPAGLSLASDGRLTGTVSEGTYPFSVRVVQGDTDLTLPAAVEAVPATLVGGAVDQADLPWVLEGAGLSRWFAQSATSRNGVAAQSPRLGDEQEARMSTIVFGPGRLGFWWKVSSEAGYDGLSWEVNGVFREFLSGEVDWTRREVVLPYGVHEVTWIYSKDVDTSEGQDAGWVDAIGFEGYTGWAMSAGLLGRSNVILDPDGDGQSLLFEYATGGRALAWDAMPVPEHVDGRLEWAVAKRPGSEGFLLEVEASDDLATWKRGEGAVLQDDESGFRVRDSRGGPSRFMRGSVHPER